MTLTLQEFQARITEIYGEKDANRGLAWSFAWLVEEVGELGAALRNLEAIRTTGQPESKKLADAEAVARNLREEFADVLAWLSSLAQMSGIDLAEVGFERYGNGCPYCRAVPCHCGKPAASSSSSSSSPSTT